MQNHKTLITAHAGAENTQANTLESIRALCECGADVVEFDVHSHNGRLVLTHDAPEPGKAYADMEECFREVAKHPGILVNVDLKEEGLIEKVEALAKECGMEGRYLFTGSVGDGEIPFVKENGLTVWYNAALLSAKWTNDLLGGVREKGFDVLNTHFSAVTDEMLKNSAQRLSVWTVQDEEMMKMLLQAGVRNITTKSPSVALRLRAEIQKEDPIEAFHREWDGFPGLARLIDREHTVVAANPAAEKAGFIAGGKCYEVPTNNKHKECLFKKAFETGVGQGSETDGLMRYWLPLKAYPDLMVHLSFKSSK